MIGSFISDTLLIVEWSNLIYFIVSKQRFVILYHYYRIERVTESFLKLLDDTNNNSKTMVVTTATMDYIDFPNPLSPIPGVTS
jgi:hypothetical protein